MKMRLSREFTRRFYDTQLFWDKYAGGKFAEYLFKAKEFIGAGKSVDADRAVQLLQEAQLFIDAAHDCHNKALGWCRARWRLRLATTRYLTVV